MSYGVTFSLNWKTDDLKNSPSIFRNVRPLQTFWGHTQNKTEKKHKINDDDDSNERIKTKKL